MAALEDGVSGLHGRPARHQLSARPARGADTASVIHRRPRTEPSSVRYINDNSFKTILH